MSTTRNIFYDNFITIQNHHEIQTTSRSIPKGPKGPGGKSYEHYDPKYNIYEEPQIVEDELEDDTEILTINYAHSTSSTLLVVGIIVVVIIAIILIIIIVIKVRAKSEVNYKVEESKALHLETEEIHVGASSGNGNGFQQQEQKAVSKVGNLASTNNNGSGSKPVKEWYVWTEIFKFNSYEYEKCKWKGETFCSYSNQENIILMKILW